MTYAGWLLAVVATAGAAFVGAALLFGWQGALIGLAVYMVVLVLGRRYLPHDEAES